ncbi:unnamed protein product, partial [Ectocarpus sp. 12 AP-2014]
FRRRRGFSVRRRTSVGQKLPIGYEGMAWAQITKLRKALLKRAGEIYAERNPELGNMGQTPVQHEMPMETTLEKHGAKDARISTGGKESERFTLCLAVMANGSKGSIAVEIARGNRSKFGHPVSGISFGVQEKSWCDMRECSLWLSSNWLLRPNHGSIMKQRPGILVLDDFRCHRGKEFIADLERKCNTTVILISGGLTPLLQPLDRMLNKQMKRLMRGKYTAYGHSGRGRHYGQAEAARAWDGVYLMQGVVDTPEVVKTCFKVCGLTPALDGSEDDAW